MVLVLCTVPCPFLWILLQALSHHEVNWETPVTLPDFPLLALAGKCCCFSNAFNTDAVIIIGNMMTIVLMEY